MPRNEKGSFRGSSDQRGERPGHLHNCRISEHGLQPGHRTGGCSSLAQGLRGALDRGEVADGAPAGTEERPAPGTRQGGGRAPSGVPGHGCGARRQESLGGSEGSEPSGARSGGVRVPGGCCPGGGGAAGDRLPAPTRRHLRRRASALPPRWLAGGSQPGGSHRHQRAGIKGLNGTLVSPAGGGAWPAPASRSPRTPPPPPAPPAPRRCPRPAPAAGRHRARPRWLIVPVTNRGRRRRPRCSGRRGSPRLLPGRGCPGTPFSAILKQQSWRLAAGAPFPPLLFGARSMPGRS